MFRRKTKYTFSISSYVSTVVRDFQRVPVASEDENIISDWLVEEQKMDFYVRIPFSPKTKV